MRAPVWPSPSVRISVRSSISFMAPPHLDYTSRRVVFDLRWAVRRAKIVLHVLTHEGGPVAIVSKNNTLPDNKEVVGATAAIGDRPTKSLPQHG